MWDIFKKYGATITGITADYDEVKIIVNTMGDMTYNSFRIMISELNAVAKKYGFQIVPCVDGTNGSLLQTWQRYDTDEIEITMRAEVTI